MRNLRLNRLEVESFMRVRALRVDAQGKHVVISGPNASGKSSTVEAIWQALAGASAKTTPQPVHRGEDQATVRLDLGAFIVERRWSEGGTKLTVTASDGSRISRPQELLDGLLDKYALDPVAFIHRRPQDQVDDVLNVCGVEAPVDEVLRITGEELPAEDGETADEYLTRLSADKTGLFYVRRHEAGRVVDQKLKARREAEEHLESLGGIVGEEEATSTTALTEQLDALYQRKQAWDAAQRRRLDLVQAVDKAERAMEDATQLIDDLSREVVHVGQEIEKLVAKRDGLVNRLEAAQRERGSVLHKRVEDAKGELLTHRDRMSQMTDPENKINETQAKLRNIEHVQQTIHDRRHQMRVVESLTREQDEALAAHKAIDDTLEALRDLRKRVLEGVDLGVDNLSIAEGELKLNGVSFKQASGAEKLRVACAIAMKQRPKLRLLRVDDGEHLDGASRAMLFELADRHDFQVVFTSVADGEALKVEVVDAAPAESEVTA